MKVKGILMVALCLLCTGCTNVNTPPAPASSGAGEATPKGEKTTMTESAEATVSPNSAGTSISRTNDPKLTTATNQSTKTTNVPAPVTQATTTVSVVENSLKIMLNRYTKLRKTTDLRPRFGEAVPGAWTELAPFVLKTDNSYKAIITTKLSGIFNLNPGKTIFDKDAYDIGSGTMITGPAYLTADGQMIPPAKVPAAPYWRRNYGSVFGTFVNGGNLYAIIHGENKNEIVNGVKYDNNIRPAGTHYSDAEYSGAGSDGVYRDAWEHYFNFLNIQWAPLDKLQTRGSLLKNDLGPILWPTDGYVFDFGGQTHQACDGLRHPSVLVDNGYIYVFYLDSSKGNGGLMFAARAPLSTGGVPGSFKKYYKGSFSEPGLPEGFNKDDRRFLYMGGGKSTPIISCNNPVRFQVARLKGTPYYVSVQEEITASGFNTIYLRVSKDLVNWSQPVEIPGIAVSGWKDGNLHDPLLYNSDFSSSTDVDASNFYIVGTSMAADAQGWPVTQYIQVDITVSEK